MRASQRGVTGLAVGLVCATVVMLVPGANAVRQPAAAPQDTTKASAALATAASAPGALTSKVIGTFNQKGTVRGSFEPARFFYKKGVVYAVGELHATMRRGDGSLVGRADRLITIPVRTATASETAGTTAVEQPDRTCEILRLVLGPLDLNLLGLEVHLNRVVLEIVATTGAGNLLGNLLCAVAGLLDGTPTLTDLLRAANILNRILSLLRL